MQQLFSQKPILIWVGRQRRCVLFKSCNHVMWWILLINPHCGDWAELFAPDDRFWKTDHDVCDFHILQLQ